MEIKEALEAAFAEADPVETVTAPIEAVAEKTEPNRDDAGKFAAKESAPETPVAEKPIEVPVRKAPSSWKPDAQTAWLKADKGEALTTDEVKLLALEGERRESDFHRGVEEFKTHAQKARAYESVVEPYRKTIESLGVDAPTAIGKLLQADHTLRFGDPATKQMYFAQLAQSYGIDIGTLQNPPQVDQQTQYLMNQINSLQEKQNQYYNSVQQQEQSRASDEITQFASDGHAHYDAVRGDMADLLETGKAKSLKDAYDMAVWMRPDIRQSLIEQQRAEERRIATEQTQHAKAKAASVSVKGSSPSSGGIQSKTGSIREALEAAFAND
jgi:hypothetical protein